MVSKQLVMSLRAFREHLVEGFGGVLYQACPTECCAPSGAIHRVLMTAGQQPNGIKIASETGGTLGAPTRSEIRGASAFFSGYTARTIVLLPFKALD
ncbi:MAG: hypothetical protein ACREX9_04555 [Gammaproteobacteria bacterium]